MLPIAGSTSFRKYQPDHPILLHISCYFPTRLQAIIATKLVYNFKVKSYLFPRNIIPPKKNIYTFYQKRIYLLSKKYILFTQKVYAFHSKSIYFSSKKYIPFYRITTTFYKQLNIKHLIQSVFMDFVIETML